MATITIKKTILISSSFSLFMLMMGCSDIKNINTETANKQEVKEKKKAEEEKLFQHEHPVNPCNGLVGHSHKYNLEETELHVHNVECDATKPVISNAHTHDAIPEREVRFYRHIHANGANDHFHNPITDEVILIK